MPRAAGFPDTLNHKPSTLYLIPKKMASKAIITQITTLALIEGFFTMLWMQQYQRRANNKTYKQLYDRLRISTTNAIQHLKKESGGLTTKESLRVSAALMELKARTFQDKPMDAMDAISMSLDLLNTILNRVSKTSAKYRLTQDVWYKVRAMEHYFDRQKKYEDPRGLAAAETFKELIGA